MKTLGDLINPFGMQHFCLVCRKYIEDCKCEEEEKEKEDDQRTDGGYPCS